jgi:alkaline phosphatase D
MSRRRFVGLAMALGASAAWARSSRVPSSKVIGERRDLYPQGVASGDPDSHSVVLWTRRPYTGRESARLRVEVSEDEAFSKVIANARPRIWAASDWTCRVIVGNLEPRHVYWYRFVDEAGNASGVGRTCTAPADGDGRPVKFAFTSCQNINTGVFNAYRRMIFEDQRASENEQLGFVLHLGDFIYELVWYPEEHPEGLWGRPLREPARYPHGQKIEDFHGTGVVHVPTTLEDYRTAYRACLRDPDLQEARARWPFVCMWDNEEFSDAGWQSMQVLQGVNRPAQTRKVAANQAWFEYQPARVVKASGPDPERFDAPRVQDAPIERFDEHGFGDEPNNHAAVGSLTGYRALRWGAHVDIILTDQRSYRSETPATRPEMQAFASEHFPQCFPEVILETVDAGAACADNRPPEALQWGGRTISNFRKHQPPQTILGAVQKQWFLQRLRASRATWKIWGNSQGMMEARIDAQNLPAEWADSWLGGGYAVMGGDPSTAYRERAEIYAAVRDARIGGFVIVSGDRHSFWAGLAAPHLPPKAFEPVGVAFITGSVTSPGMFELLQHRKSQSPLSSLYVFQRTAESKPEPTINMLVRHGVRACLEYQKTGDLQRARSLSNPDLAPHLSFLDYGAQGYTTVRATSDALECEFVRIQTPITQAATPDGGPLVYRVMNKVPLWAGGTKPRLEQHIVEGSAPLSL